VNIDNLCQELVRFAGDTSYTHKIGYKTTKPLPNFEQDSKPGLEFKGGRYKNSVFV